MPRPSDLNPDSWIDAAYERFRTGGLAAVKVEAVAKDLGATKGSFYWHFANRRALVDAVMVRWESAEMGQVDSAAALAGGPHERLTAVFTAVAARGRLRHGELSLYVDAEAEGVQDVVSRVSQRRLTFVARVLVDLGFDQGEALRRAMITTSAILGLQQLAAGTGQDVLGVAGDDLTATALRMTLTR